MAGRVFQLSSVILLALLPALCGVARGDQKAERPPNIVFILADDLGWTDLGCYGSGYYETPNIDRLAQEGMTFTHAYANGPNCAPTRASLMTGHYTPRHGITQVGDAPRGRLQARKLIEIPSRTELRRQEWTLAEALKTGGYATASIGKWHLGEGETAPETQGFDLNVAGDHRGSPPGYFAPYRKQLPGIGASPAGEYITDRLTDESVRFMEANRERPFFLYLTHFAVHSPLQAKADLIARYESRPRTEHHANPRYAAMIHSLDESVGRVLAALDRLKLQDNTLVVFTSDNGGWSGATSNHPLRGYKGMLYEGGIRVPLIVRWPGKVRPGRRSEAPVITVDHFPTLVDAAGIEDYRPHVLDGHSLVPLLTGRGTVGDRALFWHFPHYLEAGPRVSGTWRTTPAGAIRKGDFKLVEYFEDGRLELYNLKKDPGEKQDLSRRRPRKTRELHRRLQEWRASVGAKVPQRGTAPAVASPVPRAGTRADR